MNRVFNLLISCMNQQDHSILAKSNVNSDAVVINQCDHDSIEEFDFLNKNNRKCHVKFVNTTERGLSKSRNMAIANSWADVCLICDDDEVLEDNVENQILESYSRLDSAGVIIFSLIRKDCDKTYPKGFRKLGYIQLLKTSSHQITFNRVAILNNGICFNEEMGSGTGNGPSEENTFLMDCKRSGLEMYYNPIDIATVYDNGESQWFKGFTEDYFFKQGWAQKNVFKNRFYAFFYLLLFDIKHSGTVFSQVSRTKAFKLQLKGLFLKETPTSYLEHSSL